jgi:hypothetical protein
MRKLLLNGIILFILLIFAGIAFAQPPMGPPGGFGGPEGGPMRERLRQRLETMKIWKLTEAVGLTSEQSEKFFPLYNKHQKAMETIENKRFELVNRLDTLSNDPNSSDQKLNEIIGQLSDIPQQVSAERERFFKEISSMLSKRQQAKLIVFEERFRQQLQDFIRDVRREHRGVDAGDEPR